MQAIVPTFVAACCARKSEFSTAYVEYAAANHDAYFAATDGKAATVVATSGDDGYALVHRDRFGKDRGDMEFDHEAYWQSFPNLPRVLTEVAEHDADDVKVIRLDARRLDAIRKALNGEGGEVALMIVGERVAVLGERGIGVMFTPDARGNEFTKFKRVVEKYTETARAARTDHVLTF